MPDQLARVAVPALLYTVQNNMLYVGFANLEAAIGLVTYQSKIFFTGTFSLLLLGKLCRACSHLLGDEAQGLKLTATTAPIKLKDAFLAKYEPKVGFTLG